MKKLLILALIILSFQGMRSQEIYFQTGKNYTQYDYKSDTSNPPTLQAGTGNFYEIGYITNLNMSKFKYAVGLNVNEYNAIGGDKNDSYSWNTQYLGLQNTFLLVLLNKKGFEVSANAGLGISTLIYGKQNINGHYLDLSSQKEFSGLWIAPKLGLQASYNVSNDIFLSLGFAYAKNLSLSNSTPEKLSFNNNQIQFGVHFKFK